MPIDARIPLGATGVDQNSFINALAAGQKARELQNEADRLARKDEAATAKTNALRKFWTSDRGPEAIRALGIEAPDAVSGIEKNAREAENHAAQAKKLKLEWAMANHELLEKGAAGIVANPTRETALMVIEAAERQGGDMTDARRQLQNTADHAIGKLGQSWGMNAQQIATLARDQAKDARPDWREGYQGWYDANASVPPGPGAGPQQPPVGGQPPTARPGTVVPGGELPPPEDIDAEVRRRAGEGPPPTGNVDYEGLSDEGLEQLRLASSATPSAPTAPLAGSRAGPGAAAPPPAVSVPPAPAVPRPPVGGQPAPVGGPPAPAPAGVAPPPAPSPVDGSPPIQGYRTRSERDAAKDAEARRIAQERLVLEERRTVVAEKRNTPPAVAVVREADKAWLKGQDEAGAAAERLSESIVQAQTLVSGKDGVYGNDLIDRGKYLAHEWGMNDSPAAVNTERLREIGAQMTLSFGSLGSQVSNADREVYARAQGNFENAKSPEAMLLSLKEMAAVSERTIAKINRNRTTYQQTGRKPDFVPATPHPDTSPALPKPQAVKVAPQEASGNKVLPSMPKPQGQAGKWLTMPDGVVYQSDGNEWIRK